MSSATSRFFRPLNCYRRSNGYTLIEVLIAAAIFASMVTLATMALNQGLKQYQGLMEKGLNFWDYARYVWIQRSFNSATDYYIYTRDNGWTPYFIGNQDEISYVSLAPLAGDLPVVVWIRKEEENDGKRSLVYYELPVYTKMYSEMERDYVFADYKKGNSVKLLEGMDMLDVAYYAFDLALGKYQWSSDYDARTKRLLPALVKINYVIEGRKNSLIFDINVNSRIKASYNEIMPGL
jgi:general secretion pathway protein J